MDDRNNVYTVDVFIKYKNHYKEHPKIFEKYFNKNVVRSKKLLGCEILEKKDTRTKLNNIITRKNISNEDIELYSKIRYNLNMVSNGKGVAVKNLIGLSYCKMEHFQKLSDMIIEKAVSEPKFCSIYTSICSQMYSYHINIDDKKIYFRHILLNTCQTIFENYLENYESIDKDKFVGLMTMLADLYNKKLLIMAIIVGCFDRLIVLIEKSPVIAEAISNLIITSYKTMLGEQTKLERRPCDYIVEKLNDVLKKQDINLRTKFAIQNTLDCVSETKMI